MANPSEITAGRQRGDVIDATDAGHVAKPVDLSGAIKSVSDRTSMRNRILWWTREAVAFTCWTYFLIRFFVVDVDALIYKVVPATQPIFQYRFFVLAGVCSALLLMLGKVRFLILAGFVLGYPFLLSARGLVRHWPLLIVFYPAIQAAIASARRILIAGVLATFAAALILWTSNKIAIWASVIYLLSYLGHHFVRRLRMTFRPSATVIDFPQLIASFGDSAKKRFFDKLCADMRVLDRSNKANESSYQVQLLVLYAYIRCLQWFTAKVQKVAKSYTIDVFFGMALVVTVVLTILIYALAYAGLEKVIPGSFRFDGKGTILTYIGFSFDTLIPGLSGGTTFPTTWLSRNLGRTEVLCGPLVLVLIAKILMTTLRQRYARGADAVIEELSRREQEIRGFLESLDTTLEDAELYLLVTHAFPVNWIRRKLLGLDELTPIGMQQPIQAPKPR